MTQHIFDADGVYVPSVRSRAVRVKAWGGGGGGAGGNEQFGNALGGGGGGGGASVKAFLDTRSLSSFLIHVGGGGDAGGTLQDGMPGGDTIVEGASHIRVPGGMGGLTLPRPDGSQGGLPGMAPAFPGIELYPGGFGGTWTLHELYSRGGGGGTGGNIFAPGQSGGAPFGGHDFYIPPQGGDGGNGADVALPRFAQAERDASPGARPGGGGGGGASVLHLPLTCRGFSGGFTDGTLVGGFWLFQGTVVADWHSLVSVADPRQLPGLSIAIRTLSASPEPLGGLVDLILSILLDGRIYGTGFVERFLTESVTGDIWASDGLGSESAHASWDMTLVGD